MTGGDFSLPFLMGLLPHILPCAELFRGNAMSLLKNMVKTAETFKTGIIGNIDNGVIGVKEKVYGIIQTLLVEIRGWSLIEAAFKGAANIFFCHSGMPTEKVQSFLPML